MEHTNHNEGSAAATFDHIRAGSQNLVLGVHRQLGEVKAAVEKGEFVTASTVVGQLNSLLQPLALAEQTLGFLGRGRIIEGAAIVEGMELVDIGKIEELVPCERCLGAHREATLTGGGTIQIWDTNVYVVAEESVE